MDASCVIDFIQKRSVMGTMNNLSYLTPWVCGSCRNAYMASWEISCWHCGLSRAVTSGTLRQDKHKKLKAPGYSTPSPSPDKYSKARSPNHYASLPEQDKNKSSKTTGSYDIKQIMAEYRDIFRNVTRRFFLSPDDYREALEFGTEAYRVCLDIINVEHAVAVDLLSCMCMLDRRGIPRFLFSQSDNKSKDFTNAVRVLMDMSLVTENEGSFFEMHYLVQLGTKRRLEVNGDFQKRAAEVLALLSDQFPTDGYASLESYEVLEPHVQALLLNELSSSPRCRLQRARILHNSAWYATEKGSCVIGENRAQQAVDVRMELLGKDHEDTLSSQRLLAVAYRYQGKWREAEELELTISNPKNGALGGECPDPRVIMINSTTMYWDRGQSKEVENLDLQVMTPSMKASDKGHSNKVLSLANLLSIYSQQGRWEEAEEVAMQVMKTTARVLGVEHPDTLTSMVDLLWIYASRQGRRKEAFALGKELTNAGENIVRSEAQHEALPVPTPDFLVFRSQEWLRRAEKLGVQVIDTSWLEFGYVHPATVAGMINLMLIYRKQGKLPELLQLEARILTTSKRVEDPYMLMYLGHLTWTSSLSRALQLRAQKATEMFLKARTLKSQASFSTIDTKSALIEANEVKLNANTMASGTTSVEANSLMPEFSRHSVKDLLEIPVDLPRTESILTLSKSLPVEIIETQQEKFREHPSEPFDEKKRDIHLLTGFGSDNEGFLRNDTVPLKSFSADAFGSKIPEKSSLYLSKSYDERNNVHPDEDFALNGAKHHQKESISSKKPLVGASTFMEVEKSTQYLSKSYDDRSNVKPRKRITSNNETFLQLGSRPSGSYSTSGFHARRREKPPKYSSELFDTKRLNVHLRTASGSDNEGPVRDGSISSVIDVKRIEEPVKCKVEPPEPCAPDTHPHLGADPNFQGDSLRGSFLPIFDARKIKGQTGRDSFPSKLCAEKKRSVHGSQNLENKPAENVKLFVSNKNENFSTTKVKKVTAKMDAERRIGNFLAQHSDLKPLYEEALRRMDKDRFVDHVRKLLKQYFLDLSEDAKTDPDRATSHLLQDELSRIRIARHIADSFNSEYNEIRGQIGQYMHMTGSKVPDLDAWIAGNADPEAQIKAPKPEPLDYISNDDDEAFDNEDAEGENRNRALIPNAVELENTLIGGRPFQNLCMNLEFLLLPASLGSLTRILMSIPNDRIWFSAEDDLSFSNKMKTFMEDHTEENWYWWPLQPRMRVLRNSQTRLHWRCVSVPCLPRDMNII